MSGSERFPFVTTYDGANPKTNHLIMGMVERVEQIDSHAPLENSQMMGSKTMCPRIAKPPNRISWRNARIYNGRRNRGSASRDAIYIAGPGNATETWSAERITCAEKIDA
eukprot:scaffold7775_cov61-Cyclotella_meneghiniana.AAC.2